MDPYLMPKKPDERQVLVLLDQADIQSFAYEDGASKLIEDTNCAVIPVPYPEDDPIINDMKKRHMFRKGVVLVQSPFDCSKYEDVSVARDVFPLDKQMFFSNICGWLGAKTVSVVQVEKHTTRRDRETKTEVKVAKVTNGRVDTKDVEINKLTQSITLNDVYTGAEPNIQEALTQATKTGLIHDPTVYALIKAREISGNTLMVRELELSLSSELERIIDLVFNLDVPSYVEVDFNYKSIVQTRSEYVLKLRVEF